MSQIVPVSGVQVLGPVSRILLRALDSREEAVSG